MAESSSCPPALDEKECIISASQEAIFERLQGDTNKQTNKNNTNSWSLLFFLFVSLNVGLFQKRANERPHQKSR